MNEKRDFLDFIQTLLKYKKLLIYAFIISTVLSIGISLVLPLWYRSSARLLFPYNENALGMDMSMILGNVPLDLGQKGSVKNERLGSILKSRLFLDDVIKKFDLQEVYNQEYLFLTREMLLDNISMEFEYDDQSIKVSFDYKNDPKKAFEILTYMISKANELNMKMQSAEAHNNRVFIERTYDEAQSRISAIEDSLHIFQEKYGVYLLDEQMKATIEVQAITEQQLIEAKIERNFMRGMIHTNNPKLKELDLRISAIENELTKLQQTVPDYSVMLPLKIVGGHALTFYKLKRELEIGAKVLTYLTPQYEQAKIQEVQSKPSYVILDHPNIPEYKYKPKRSLVVLGSVFLSMFLIFIYILLFEAINSLERRDRVKYEKLKLIFAQLGIKLR